MDQANDTSVTTGLPDDCSVWENNAFDDADFIGEPIGWMEHLNPANETDILVFDTKYTKAARSGDHLHDIQLGVWMPAHLAFANEHDSDAHFVAYHYAGPPVRVLKAYVEGSPTEGRPEMRLVVFDVDERDAHEQGRAASEEWRAQQRECVARFLEAHPGAFVYDTRGGYRIVLRIPPRCCNEDWAAYYLACLDHVATFGIVADPACKDYTRLFRLPRVLRNGVPERRELLGDASNIGFFDFIPTPESMASHRPSAKTSPRVSSPTTKARVQPYDELTDAPLRPLAEAWRVEGAHEVNLAIASVLAIVGWSVERSVGLVARLNALVNGPWAEVAVADVRSSYSRTSDGQSTTGWPTLRRKAPGVARALAALLERTEAARPREESPKAAIEAALLAKQSANARSRVVWRLVQEDLVQTKSLFVAQDKAVYSVDLDTPIVEPVFSSVGGAKPTPGFAAFVGERYGLNQSEKIFEFVMHEIRNTAMRVRRQVRRLSFFDRITSTLYVSNGAAGIYRIDGDGFDPVRCLVPNGTDDVYFVSRRADEAKPRVTEGTQGALRRYLLDNLSLSASEFERAAILRLLESFLLLPFFRELLQTVPILVMVGPKGSGKSTTLRAYLKVLLGPDAEVQALPDKQDGFDALVVRDRLVVLDNVDRYAEWLQDRLAVLATGGEITRRTLYTDFDTASARPETVLAITTRQPHFKRDDIVDRTLVVPLETRETFEPEASLLARISDARPEILGDILGLADRVVRSLRDPSAVDPGAAQLRMADFSSFACRVAVARGDDEAARSRMLEIMDARQREFFAEDDPIFMAIDAWMSSKGAKPMSFISAGATPFVPETMYKAAQLYNALRISAEVNCLPWGFQNVRSFGQAMVERKRWLKQRFGLTIRSNPKGNTYTFDPPARTVQQPSPDESGSV